ALEENPLRSKEILLKFKYIFIIRDPEKSIKSYYKAAKSRTLYDLIKDTTREEIAIVDANYLIREPKKILRKYCEMVNIEFKKEMIEMKEERVKIWDLKMS
ncbi:7639_t:CDS:2, partial [Gigaspora rosea]